MLGLEFQALKLGENSPRALLAINEIPQAPELPGRSVGV